jgi:hypothetical protein
MSEDTEGLETSAQTELRAIAEELKAIEERLRVVHGSLPESTGPEQEEEEETDLATEIRAAIECVLMDNLDPATRTLNAASKYRGRPQE